MTNPDSPLPPRLRWRLWLLALVAAGYCLLVLRPSLVHRLGVLDHGVWFVDSYALLATSDAVRLGLDPAQPNPLDVYLRQHSYTHWWFALGRLGLTREDNFLLGGGIVLLFFATALWQLAPRRRAEMFWQLALLLSPPVILAVNRANNDLVVFALLGLGLRLTGRGEGARPAWLGAAAALGTGLKFFPLVAAGALVGLRPARRGLAWTAGALLAALLVLATVWTDFGKAVFPVPVGTYVFGASIFWRNLGWMGPAPVYGSLVLLAAGAGLLAQRGWTAGLGREEDPARITERLSFLVGALLLLACFAAGISYAYRWVFALWLAPWLWTQAWEAPSASRSQLVARLGFGLLTLALWMDGLYCAAMNTFVGPMELARLRRCSEIWNCSAQPVVWLLMLLLAGWVAGALLDVGRELARRPAPTAD